MRVEALELRRLLAAIRFASWNTLNNPDTSFEDADFQTILQAIGNETVQSIQQPIDILALQETDFAGSSGSIGRIENIFESIYPTIDYASIVTTLDGGGDATGFVFNTSTITLLESMTVPGSLTHRIMRAKFRPASVATSDRDFYAYSIHLKAGVDPSDFSKRTSEAAILRADADALGNGANVMFVGDFNLQNSFESAWSNLTASGNAQLFDPINRPGSWHNNNAYKDIHTQNPMNDPAGGYMDDRFDFQLISNEFTDGGGIEYIAGSYRAFGNNGTHQLNGPITSGSGASPAVLSALALASDHLPVVVDYDIGSVTPGVRITETGSETSVSETGDADSYSVVLNSVPTHDVVVTLNIDGQLDLGNGGGISRSLTFTPANALVPQIIAVNAVDDTIPESLHTSTIVHSTTSLDPNYNLLSGIDEVVVSIDDNDITVVISEIMYNPLSDETAPGLGEWIEIVNTGTGAIDISGWTFDDEDNGPGQDWGPFPNGTILGVNEIAVFFDSAFTNEIDFRNEWAVPTAAKVIGISWGQLDNSPSATNEVLELKDDLGAQVDFVNYDDGGTWPTDNPSGPSIYLENLSFNNTFGQNWSRSDIGLDDGRAASGPVFDPGDIGSPGHAPGVVPSTVTISINDVSANENAGTLTFTISASPAPSSDLFIDIASSDLTALTGSDYVAIAGTATIPAFSSSTTVEIPIVDDLMNEATESFQITLSNPSGGAVIGDAIGIGTILDDDVSPTIFIDDLIIVEGTPSVEVIVNVTGGFLVTTTATFIQVGDGGPLIGGSETTNVTAVDTSSSVFAASGGYDPFIGYAGITAPPSPLVDPSWGLFDPGIHSAVLDGELFRFTVDTSALLAGAIKTVTLDTQSITGLNPMFDLFGGGTVTAVGDLTATITVNPPAGTIAGRHIFYNDSFYDGDSSGYTPSDSDAIDPSKSALLPGETATFANYTGFTKGINGVMVDIANAANPSAISVSDFLFKVSDSETFTAAAPSPQSVTFVPAGGVGGSDRFVFIWANDAIESEWLQITVLANSNTGLTSDDVHYWGNAPGDTGDSVLNAIVNSSDINEIRLHFNNFLNPASVDNPFDVDKTRLINSTDVNLARLAFTSFLTDLNLITVDGGAQASSLSLLSSSREDDDWARAVDQAMLGLLF